MAKYETSLQGDFAQILSDIESGILDGSLSAIPAGGSQYARA